jgi:hypothetical protein
VGRGHDLEAQRGPVVLGGVAVHVAGQQPNAGIVGVLEDRELHPEGAGELGRSGAPVAAALAAGLVPVAQADHGAVEVLGEVRERGAGLAHLLGAVLIHLGVEELEERIKDHEHQRHAGSLHQLGGHRANVVVVAGQFERRAALAPGGDHGHAAEVILVGVEPRGQEAAGDFLAPFLGRDPDDAAFRGR